MCIRDSSNASRAIREEEVALCEAIGRTPLEFRVGTDALAVVVNPANDFATDLTLEQLALAFSTAETWADAVSYTHLDVYKRQRLGLVVRRQQPHGGRSHPLAAREDRA